MQKDFKKYQPTDDKFESFLDSVLQQFVETEFTPEKRKARRARADADDLEFCKIYFPKIFNCGWNELHLRTANLGPGMYTRSGFRRCGKSALTYIVYIVKAISLNIGGMCGINCQTLDDLSKERTAAIKRLIMRNQLLIYDYGIELIQDLRGHYIFQTIDPVNQGKKKESSATHLVAGSVNKGLRAMMDDEFTRFRRIVNDDLYDRTNVASENHCARVVDFIESEVTGQLEEDGIAITLGNATAEKAPIVTLREKNPENHFGLPALDENENSTWPEYMADADAWEELKQRKKISWDVWEGDYMDKPAVRGDIFDPDDLTPVNINLMKIVVSISAADPSYGKSPSACDKGLVTIGLTDKDVKVVLDIYLRKHPYDQFFDYVAALRKNMPGWKVLLFEDDFSQWEFAKPYYDMWKKKRNDNLPIIRHSAKELKTDLFGADKDSRIMNLAYPHETHDIVYDEQIMRGKDWDRYRAQYLAFGKAKTKLDGLDAAATAFIMIGRYASRGSFKPLKSKTFGGISWFRKS